MDNKQLEQVLIDLASKLGTTVEHLWGVLVAQAQIDAIIATTYLIAYILYSIFAFGAIKRLLKTDIEEGEAFAIVVLGGLGVVFTVITLSGTIPRIISGFLNPEYRALELLRGLI